MGSDRQLVAALRAGDAAAFDAVYESYRPRLFGFLARLSGDPPLAEDLLQETFLRLARHAHELREDTRLSAWLFTVARNLFVSQKRWALLDVGKVAELRLWARLRAAELGDPCSPLAIASANETERLLEEAISRLPLRYREVILLTALEGMTPAEAAQVLGLKSTAVRQRLSRARDMLQLDLERAPGQS